MLRYAVAGTVAVVALGLVLESWGRGFLPGDPDHVAGRMRNVVSLGAMSAGLALASMLPLGGVVRAALLVLAALALLAAVAYRAGWL